MFSVHVIMYSDEGWFAARTDDGRIFIGTFKEAKEFLFKLANEPGGFEDVKIVRVK